MPYNFSNISVLIVNDVPSTMKIMTTALKIHQVKDTYEAMDGGHAFSVFEKHKPDVIITELDMNPADGRWLSKKIRCSSGGGVNREVPIILMTGNKAALSISDIRDAGFNELLMMPFSVSSIADRIAYVLNNPKEFISSDNYTGPDRRYKQPEDYDGVFRRATDDISKKTLISNESTAAVNEQQQVVEEEALDNAPPAEEAEALLHTLFDHYIQHSEILLKKLMHAQTATKQSIEEAKAGEGKKEKLSNFERMWKEVIDLFLSSGLSENDISSIERLITTIPEDIGQHYKKLSEQDESLKKLIKNLDSEAYKNAHAVATKLQDKANPLSGMKAEDYEAKIKGDKNERPVVKKQVFKVSPVSGKFKT